MGDIQDPSDAQLFRAYGVRRIRVNQWWILFP